MGINISGKQLSVVTVLATALVGAGYAQAQDQANAMCTRDELFAATTHYVTAQQQGDPELMALADDARYLENMNTIEKGDGLWNTALPIALTRSFHDVTRCKTFTEIIVTEGDHQYVIGTRLYMDAGEVIRVDSLVTDEGDWLFNANAYLKYASMEDWDMLAPAERVSEEALINAGNSYLDLFSDKFRNTPWGIPCARLEGGAYTDRNNDPDASCEVGIPDGVLYINNRDYVVDLDMGVVNIFCRFGNSETGMPDSHTFKLVNGRLRYVHTLSVNLSDIPSPQATDDGEIIR